MTFSITLNFCFSKSSLYARLLFNMKCSLNLSLLSFGKEILIFIHTSNFFNFILVKVCMRIWLATIFRFHSRRLIHEYSYVLRSLTSVLFVLQIKISAHRNSRRVKRSFLSEKSETHKNSLVSVKDRTGTAFLPPLPGWAVSSRPLLTLHFIALTRDTNETLINRENYASTQWKRAGPITWWDYKVIHGYSLVNETLQSFI